MSAADDINGLLRARMNDPAWRKRRDVAIFVGSALPALPWGVALTKVAVSQERAKNLGTMLARHDPAGARHDLTG